MWRARPCHADAARAVAEEGEVGRTAKKLPFELHDALLRTLATREASSKFLTMALDVLTHMRTAGATPKQTKFALRIATALAGARSTEELHGIINWVIMEERHQATE